MACTDTRRSHVCPCLPTPSARRGRDSGRERKSSPAQLRRPRARVSPYLHFIGDDRIAVLRRIDAGSRPVAKGILDAPILAGVKADDGRDAPGLEHFGQNREQAIEVGQFTVDQDAQGLKRPRRGVELGPRGTLNREIRASQMIAMRSCVVVIGVVPRRSTMSRAMCGASVSSPSSRIAVASSSSLMRLTSFQAGVPRVGSMRMSSGPGFRYEKPRSGSSICVLETPTSASIASTRPSSTPA